jgi:hypothetical protein
MEGRPEVAAVASTRLDRVRSTRAKIFPPFRGSISRKHAKNLLSQQLVF